MTRLPIIIRALVATTALTSFGALGSAEAGGVHFSGGAHFGGGGFHGSVHVGGGAHWAAPAYRSAGIGFRGHVWVGGGRPYYYPYYGYGYGYYYPYYYPYVPSYYSASYYPVQPEYAGPSVAAVVIAQPPLPRFGVGLFAGGVNTDYNTQTDTKESDYGLLARFRLTDGLLVEGELGKTTYDVGGVSNVRVDRRLGASLIYEIGARNRLAPYLLAGFGVQQADLGGGNYNTTQDFGELGVGLRFAVTEHFHLTLDVRAGTRSTVSSDQMTAPANGAAQAVAPPTSASNQNEDYTRGRLAAILYF